MPQVAANDSRLPALDLLRFVAALAVTLYHYVTCYPSDADAAQLGIATVSAVTRYGYLGVDLFFMISGFVILWSSLGRDATSFAIGRISRLYPSFWVSLALTIFWIQLLGSSVPQIETAPLDAATIAANATMMPTLFDAPRIEDIYWTLEIEIRFYALIFLILLLRQMAHIELFLYSWLAISIGSLVTDPPWIVHYVFLKPYGAFFVAGGLFYLLYARGVTASRVIGLAIAAATCAYVSIVQRGGFITADSESAFAVPILVVLFFGLFAFMCLRKAKPASSALFYRLGALTYPLYLTHAMMGVLLYEVLLPKIGAVAALVAITAIALTVAWAIAFAVDVPARKPFANLLFRWARALRLVPKATPRASTPTSMS
jgi:peptidoglycan/LPS O-acetylase OafA/YrhL